MQTYSFDELSDRAQSAAHAKYGLGVSAFSPDLDLSDASMDVFVTGFLIGSGWRFTEHGERIA